MFKISNFKKFRKLSAMLIVLIGLTSCQGLVDAIFGIEDDPAAIIPETKKVPGVDTPTTESDENSTVTYQFSEKVELLSEYAQNNYLIKVEKDSILFFLSETPDSIMPKVGEILSSRISDKLPYGLGNKVISKTEEDGLVKFVTSVAPLDEIYKELELESEFTTEDLIGDITSLTDEDGNVYDVQLKDIYEVFHEETSALTRWQTRASLGSDKVLEIPISVKTKSGLFTEINFLVGAILTFDYSLLKGTYELSLLPSIGVTGELGFKKEKEGDYLVEEAANKLCTLLKKTRLFSGIVQAGGLTLRPFADLNLDLVGSISGEASVGFSYFARYKWGTNEKGDIRENLSTKRDLNSIFNSFELKGRVEVGPQATLSTGCGLYTSDIALTMNTKPTIMVGGELAASVNTSNGERIKDQKLTFDVFVDVNLNATASILGKEFFNKNYTIAKWNIFNGEIPIFPKLKSNSFDITYKGTKVASRGYSRTRDNDSSHQFYATLSLEGGEMTKIMRGCPAIIVEKDGQEIQRVVSTPDVFSSEQTELSLPLPDLEPDVTYTAVPCIIFDNHVYHWDPKTFTAATKFCPDDNHPHMIDLGLPSETKWSCCYLGADNPTEAGNRYAFGETKVKDEYTKENYEHLLWYSPNPPADRDSYSILYLDGATGYWTAYRKLINISGTAYDAAHAIWGEPGVCLPLINV